MRVVEKWSLVTLDDPERLTGGSLLEVIALMQRVAEFRYVIIDFIEGSGSDWQIADLNDRANEPMIIEELLKALKTIKHIEWGDFFFFKEDPRSWDCCTEESYSAIVSRADTTLRAVDDQYMYIYSRLPEVLTALTWSYTIESHLHDTLANLPHP